MSEQVTEFEKRIDEDPVFDDKHHSMYCAIGFFNAFNETWPVYRLELADFNVYYTLEAYRVNILGTLNHYTKEEIDRVCAWMFAQYKGKYVNWGGFYEPYDSPVYHVHKTGIVSDIIMDLPDSEQGYLAMLNKTTRKHVQYYKRRFLRDYPEAEFKVYRGREITKELISTLVHYNHLRMEAKNSHSDLDEKEEQGTYELCQSYGVVHTVENHGEILGGTINPHINRHSHLAIISHHPDYDKYNVGQIALYETIVDSIKDGDEQFHFLWEIVDYKKRFGGHLVELYYYHIYPKQSLSCIADNVKCKVTCSLMYFQKRSETGRKVIDQVKKVIGKK